MPNSIGLPFGSGSVCGAVQRRRANHFERMEARLLQHLELVDVAEAVGLVDKPGVRSGRDAAAGVLEVVDERHPHLVEPLPLDLVFGGPVEPVGAVRVAVRLIEIPQRRQRVLVVPVGVAHAHHVAARRIDRHGRIDR